MIHRIFSDLPEFKTLVFHDGLNILLADKTLDATDRQTRNGAGKTSLIELIHFLLGSNVTRRSIFKTEALSRANFSMAFDLSAAEVTVSRSGVKPSQVSVQGLSLQGEQTVLPGEGESIRNDDWKALLGLRMFGLPEQEEKWGLPSDPCCPTSLGDKQMPGSRIPSGTQASSRSGINKWRSVTSWVWIGESPRSGNRSGSAIAPFRSCERPCLKTEYSNPR
jgi:hypothetical protein